MNILVIGSYGRHNIGDDVFLLAAVEVFHGHNIFINSANDDSLPKSVIGKVQTISTVSNRDFVKKIKTFLKIKYVFYWGGDLWVKLYGDKFPRQALYKMLATNLICRLFGKKIFYVGVGVGDLRGYDLFLARSSARLANKIIVREQRTADIIGLPAITVLPDIAVNLPLTSNKGRPKKGPRRPFHIALSVMYRIDKPDLNFSKYISDIASFVNTLDSKLFTISLIPMYVNPKDPRDDVWACEQLKKSIKNEIGVDINNSHDLDDFLKHLSKSNLVIGTRLHANILATLCQTPCIGISYRPKVKSFFDNAQLSQYCLDFSETDKIDVLFQDIYGSYNSALVDYRNACDSLLKGKLRYNEIIHELLKAK